MNKICRTKSSFNKYLGFRPTNIIGGLYSVLCRLGRRCNYREFQTHPSRVSGGLTRVKLWVLRVITVPSPGSESKFMCTKISTEIVNDPHTGPRTETERLGVKRPDILLLLWNECPIHIHNLLYYL